MNNIPMVSYWMGKPVVDYTKEQLIQIINVLVENERIAIEQHRREFNMFVTLRRAS
jgi:hypothetical protein